MYNDTNILQECHSDIYVGVYIIREMKGEMLFGTDEEKVKVKYLWQCLTDWKTFVSRRFPLPNPTSVGHCDDFIHSWIGYGNVGVVS